jgi:hypothetical protein
MPLRIIAALIVAAAAAVAIYIQIAPTSPCNVGGTTIAVGSTAVINGTEWLCDGGLPADLG